MEWSSILNNIIMTADSGMEQYIEQDYNDIGDNTNDHILLRGESDVNEK